MRRSVLHQFLLPALRKAKPDPDEFPPHVHANSLMQAEMFDACDLPIGFVLDSGEAAFEEMRATQQHVRLPFPSCFFDFAGYEGWRVGVFAEEHGNYAGLITEEMIDHDPDDGDPPGATRVQDTVEVRSFAFKDRMPEDIYESWHTHAEFRNGLEVDGDDWDPFFEVADAEGNAAEMQEHGAKLLLGALSLLTEKLIVSRFEPDPEPRLTKARLKRGQYPVTGASRVLSVNVPALRAAAKPLGGTHESPCLHWRRGHWRVLYRGSEFEKQAWVNKCLVGDPAKGYVRHDYRLVHRFPMLANDNPPPPPEPLGAA